MNQGGMSYTQIIVKKRRVTRGFEKGMCLLYTWYKNGKLKKKGKY